MPKPLPERKFTLYDVLGVPRNAKLTDITRAYNRHRSEVTREDQPPDLKRETLIREAYETLSDPDRRDAYDASLRDPDRRHRSRMRAIVIGIVGVGLAGGYMFFARKPSAPGEPMRTSQEVQVEAAAVGRLHSIDTAGHETALGVAFTIGDRERCRCESSRTMQSSVFAGWWPRARRDGRSRPRARS
jgi:DnaJ-class molecular chaperone